MTESKSPSSRLDDATEAWLQEMEKAHGPGAARISRTMANWAAYEELALRFYRAIEQGQAPPDITDAVERYFAHQMGEAVADLRQANADKDSFWERAHRSAVSRVHAAIHRYRCDRDELGMPPESSPEEISTAVWNRNRPPTAGPR
jgi:hypothetical protein